MEFNPDKKTGTMIYNQNNYNYSLDEKIILRPSDRFILTSKVSRHLPIDN